VPSRLESLAQSGLIASRNGTYAVAGRGSAAFRLIFAYRKLYGTIPKGG
jgi:hypothetical protein